MTDLEAAFEAAWSKAWKKKAQGPRIVRMKVVAVSKKRRAGKPERTSQQWKSVRAEVKKQLPTPPRVEGSASISEFMGRTRIGFEGEVEPMLLQRRGGAQQAPKHWSEDQVELQEMRDLFIMGRAHGTWVSYARWWRLFDVHARVRGVQTCHWQRDSRADLVLSLLYCTI